MKLETMRWTEVEDYLADSDAIILPIGSTEQHGPIGLIGTDTICAREIAFAAAERVAAIVAPEMPYTPAPFNMSFPGTVSVSASLFSELFQQVVSALARHGFRRFYVLNGHGANLEPLQDVIRNMGALSFRVRSWWEYPEVNALRTALYGDWEGMHATPSEVAITQARLGIVHGGAENPPEKLSRAFILSHAGDRHGPPDEHREMFPDGRVGSHSALANKNDGQRLFDLAVDAMARDYEAFRAASSQGS